MTVPEDHPHAVRTTAGPGAAVRVQWLRTRMRQAAPQALVVG